MPCRLSVSVIVIDRLYAQNQNDLKCIAIVKPKFHTVCFLTTFIIPYCKRAASTIQSPSMIFLVLSSCGQPDWFQLAAIPIPVSICLTLSVSLPLSLYWIQKLCGIVGTAGKWWSSFTHLQVELAHKPVPWSWATINRLLDCQLSILVAAHVANSVSYPRGSIGRCHYIYIMTYTSSTAQGGGGSCRNRKPLGEVGCCEPRMAEPKH